MRRSAHCRVTIERTNEEPQAVSYGVAQPAARPTNCREVGLSTDATPSSQKSALYRISAQLCREVFGFSSCNLKVRHIMPRRPLTPQQAQQLSPRRRRRHRRVNHDEEDEPSDYNFLFYRTIPCYDYNCSRSSYGYPHASYPVYGNVGMPNIPVYPHSGYFSWNNPIRYQFAQPPMWAPRYVYEPSSSSYGFPTYPPDPTVQQQTAFVPLLAAFGPQEGAFLQHQIPPDPTDVQAPVSNRFNNIGIPSTGQNITYSGGVARGNDNHETPRQDSVSIAELPPNGPSSPQIQEEFESSTDRNIYIINPPLEGQVIIIEESPEICTNEDIDHPPAPAREVHNQTTEEIIVEQGTLAPRDIPKLNDPPENLTTTSPTRAIMKLSDYHIDNDQQSSSTNTDELTIEDHPPAPAREVHNQTTGEIIVEQGTLAPRDISELNVPPEKLTTTSPTRAIVGHSDHHSDKDQQSSSTNTDELTIEAAPNIKHMALKISHALKATHPPTAGDKEKEEEVRKQLCGDVLEQTATTQIEREGEGMHAGDIPPDSVIKLIASLSSVLYNRTLTDKNNHFEATADAAASAVRLVWALGHTHCKTSMSSKEGSDDS